MVNGRGNCGGGGGAGATILAPDASGRGRGGTWELAGEWAGRLRPVEPCLAVPAGWWVLADTRIRADGGLGAGPAWAVLREVVRRGMQGEDWRLGISVRALTGAYCHQVVPPPPSPLPALFARDLIVCRLQSAMPRTRKLGIGAIAGNSVFSVKFWRFATRQGATSAKTLCPPEALRSGIFIF